MPWSAGPTCHYVVAAVAQFHCRSAHAFWDPSLRPESVSLVVCAVLMKLLPWPNRVGECALASATQKLKDVTHRTDCNGLSFDAFLAALTLSFSIKKKL